MIKKMDESNREQCLNFAKEKPAENIFIIGDIEAFGFEEDFQDVWGDVGPYGNLQALLLRYYDNFIVYAPSTFNAESLAKIIENFPKDKKIVSGISTTVDQVVVHISLHLANKREFYYAKCDELNKTITIPSIRVRKASIDDVPRIVSLQSQVPEFDMREGRAKSLKKNMEKGVSRSYVGELEEEIISVAMSTAENSISAMIVGVCTLENHKKKGYATACMFQLCKEMLSEGKHLCLFYDNPEAGIIYKRLGFNDIGTWTMTNYD